VASRLDSIVLIRINAAHRFPRIVNLFRALKAHPVRAPVKSKNAAQLAVTTSEGPLQHF
jgi:hypothetical protein